MDLFIKTLTGTGFELRVSPNDTVVSIKLKIQRVEGIPIGQQHLIWNNGELSDHQSLKECSIPGGATLRLVLGLRGGPVNTYRSPTIRLTPFHFTPPSPLERIAPCPKFNRSLAVSSPQSIIRGSSTHVPMEKHNDRNASSSEFSDTARIKSVIDLPSKKNIEMTQDLEGVHKDNSVISPSVNLSATLNNSSELPDNGSASSVNNKHITFVIFNGSENVNLLRVLDRTSPTRRKSQESLNYVKSKSPDQLNDELTFSELYGSSSYPNDRSLPYLQSEPSIGSDDVDQQKSPNHVISLPSILSTDFLSKETRSNVSSDSARQSVSTRISVASPIPISRSQLTTPPKTSINSLSAPPSAAAALLAGLIYATNSRHGDGTSIFDEDLASSDGEQSNFPCSYWLRPPSPEWDYHGIPNLKKNHQEIGYETCLNDEFPFFDDDSEALGSGGDDDSLADLEDYFLYYRTGDVLFGPSPRNSILRDSLLNGIDSPPLNKSFEATAKGLSTSSHLDECSLLAEKVKNIKSQLGKARENRLKRHNLSNNATTEVFSNKVTVDKLNSPLSEYPKDQSKPMKNVKSVDNSKLKISKPTTKTSNQWSSKYSTQRPYTSFAEGQEDNLQQDRFETIDELLSSRRYSFDGIRPRRTAPPISMPKLAEKFDTPRLRQSMTSNKTLPDVCCFSRSFAESENPSSYTRQRRFGTVEPPDISQINESIFPPLFPKSSSSVDNRPSRLTHLSRSPNNDEMVRKKPSKFPAKDLFLPPLFDQLKSCKFSENCSGIQKAGIRFADDSLLKRIPKLRQDVSELPSNPHPNQRSVGNRCASCNRKMGLANSYSCRCEQLFCSQHRYAEVHSCPYDYKAEARRCIRESNPVITAAKLPKI